MEDFQAEWSYEIVKKDDEQMWQDWKGPSAGAAFVIRGDQALEDVVQTIRADPAWRDGAGAAGGVGLPRKCKAFLEEEGQEGQEGREEEEEEEEAVSEGEGAPEGSRKRKGGGGGGADGRWPRQALGRSQ